MRADLTVPTGERLFSPAGFDYQPRTRIVFGPGSLERLGAYAAELGARRVLLVTDGGIVAAGHARRAHDAMAGASVSVTTFDAVHENPTTLDVDTCLSVAKTAGVDAIVGLGGGSSIDTAKGCNFLLTNGGKMRDYWGVGKASRDMLPLIAVPTTAGTGSECQSFALIADETTHQKMACGDPKAAARIAILDPVLTLTQPPQVAACTGMDAVVHAVETAVTKPRNPLSLLFSHEAFRLAHAALPRVLGEPQDLEARGQMLLGAAYGGMAIENSMLGAAHAAANPLTAHHDVVHGHAVGLLLPHVVRHNAQDTEARRAYAELLRRSGLGSSIDDDQAAVSELVDRIELLLNATGLPSSLSGCGIPRAAIEDLANEAAKQWTAQFNPRAVGRDDFVGLYESAYE